MRSLTLTFALVMMTVVPALAAAPASKPASRTAKAAPPAPPAATESVKSDAFAGRYISDDKSDNIVLVKRIDGSLYRVAKSGEWDGVGIFDGAVYRGVFRYLDKPADPGLAGASGFHRAVLEKDGSFRVHGEFLEGADHTFENVWTRAATTPPTGKPARAARSSSDLPAFGEYVYVDELPEAVTKVPPVYPEPARQAGVQGTVVVQALVAQDGRVVDTMIVKGIPMLDAAAEACVRQWVFKPALKAGDGGQPSKPVGVWVAVPVKFTIDGARASD